MHKDSTNRLCSKVLRFKNCCLSTYVITGRLHFQNTICVNVFCTFSIMSMSRYKVGLHTKQQYSSIDLTYASNAFMCTETSLHKNECKIKLAMYATF